MMTSGPRLVSESCSNAGDGARSCMVSLMMQIAARGSRRAASDPHIARSSSPDAQVAVSFRGNPHAALH